MPRRLPVRPAKLIGNLFVLAALSLIFLVYYVYVGLIMGPKLMGKRSFTSPKQLSNFLNRQSSCNSELVGVPLAVYFLSLVLFPGDDNRPWAGASFLGKSDDL